MVYVVLPFVAMHCDLETDHELGVVYEAKQLNPGRTVALKTVLVSRMGSASSLSRFELESRTVAKLRHPNIIGGYDFGRSDGRVYFAMELVEGDELAELVKRKEMLDERFAWGIARQTAAGLAHAANHGVVHRDIKPGNMWTQPESKRAVRTPVRCGFC